MKFNPYKLFTRVKRSSENARHAKRSWRKRAPQFSLSNTVLCLSLLFLFIPLFVITFYSFNSAKDIHLSKYIKVEYQRQD